MLREIELTNVMSVYSGKDGKCCCGCAGKHTYASAHRQLASKKRGYEVKDDEVKDHVVAQVVDKINSVIAFAEQEDGYVCAVIGTRLYVAYMTTSN